MEIKEHRIAGVFEIVLEPIRDNRGFFMRTFDRDLFEEAGLNRTWVQENHSRSERSGIIRGLHFQFPPHAETKLVRCIRGAVLDAFVDLRTGSETFGQWGSVELDESRFNMVFIPRGFAHGYCTLSEESEVLYKVDNFYDSASEGGIIWNDPDIGIDWPIRNPELSDKDRANMTLEHFIHTYRSIDA